MKFSLKSFIVAVVLTISIFTVHAQAKEVQRGTPVAAQCGSIIDSDFASNFEEDIFTISMTAGDTLDISLTPIGEQLKSSIFLTGPTNLGVAASKAGADPNYFYNGQVEAQPKMPTGILGANGKYTIRVVNFSYYNYYFGQDNYNPGDPGNIGSYTLYVGCTLKDGTVIAPGDVVAPPTPVLPTVEPTQSPDDPSFVGFPGIEPKNFADGIAIPFNIGLPNAGSIAPGFDSVFGFTLDGASAGDTLDLTFTRLSGNLNLGLVVLSADNKVVFQASLVSSTTLNSRFTLPSAGQYTIGVFRIDLLPPDLPEATAFQIEGTLNP